MRLSMEVLAASLLTSMDLTLHIERLLSWVILCSSEIHTRHASALYSFTDGRIERHQVGILCSEIRVPIHDVLIGMLWVGDIRRCLESAWRQLSRTRISEIELR